MIPHGTGGHIILEVAMTVGGVNKCSMFGGVKCSMLESKIFHVVG